MIAQLVFDLEAALADVEDQRERDHLGADANGNAGRLGSGRTPTFDYVRVRMAGVLQAARAPGEPFAFRQSLIDLAAAATELAATMERPTA